MVSRRIELAGIGHAHKPSPNQVLQPTHSRCARMRRLNTRVRFLIVTDVDVQFLEDLRREDDLGLVIRGHLHIEHQLISLASGVLPFASRIDWNEVPFKTKLEIASACGLPDDRRELIRRLNVLRNDFAHRLSASVQKKTVVDIYNSLSPLIQDAIKRAHEIMGFGKFPGPAALEPRDLLIHLFISARQATKAAADATRQQSN